MENWYSKVISYKDENGEPLVMSAQFRNVCPKCRLKDPRDWPSCDHVSPIPDADHKSAKAMEKWTKVYEAHGLDSVAQRENFGMITEDEHTCFNALNIERCFMEFYRPELSLEEARSGNIPFLFTCIDPNGGSMDANYTALATGYRNIKTGDVVLLWASREKTQDQDQLENFLEQNIVQFRDEFNELRNMPMVVITEANGRYDGDTIASFLSGKKTEMIMPNFNGGVSEFKTKKAEYGPIAHYRQKGKQKFGIHKDPKLTTCYVNHMHELINNANFFPSKDFNTYNRTEGKEKILDEIKDGLKVFRYMDKDPYNPAWGKTSDYYTSYRRTTGKINGKNDDLTIACLMLGYFSTKITEESTETEDLTKMTNFLSGRKRMFSGY